MLTDDHNNYNYAYENVFLFHEELKHARASLMKHSIMNCDPVSAFKHIKIFSKHFVEKYCAIWTCSTKY